MSKKSKKSIRDKQAHSGEGHCPKRILRWCGKVVLIGASYKIYALGMNPASAQTLRPDAPQQEMRLESTTFQLAQYNIPEPGQPTCVQYYGGNGGGNRTAPGPSALQQASEEADEIRGQLEPLLQQQRQESKEIQTLQKRRDELRKLNDECRHKIQILRAQQAQENAALTNLSVQFRQLQEQYERGLVDLAVAEAHLDRSRRGQNAMLAPDPSNLRWGSDVVDLSDKDLKDMKVDLGALVTKSIYDQAVRERDRNQKLAADLRGALNRIDEEQRKLHGVSAEFEDMMRKESRGVMVDVLDSIAPVEMRLKAATKVSPQLLRDYVLAYESLKVAFTLADQNKEGVEKVHTALTGFGKATTAVLAAGVVDKETANCLKFVVIAGDAFGKVSLADTAEERDTKLRFFAETLAAVNPYGASAEGVLCLTERGARRWVISSTLDKLSAATGPLELGRLRLQDKLERCEANASESERIIRLWQASHPQEGARP